MKRGSTWFQENVVKVVSRHNKFMAAFLDPMGNLEFLNIQPWVWMVDVYVSPCEKSFCVTEAACLRNAF